MAETVWIDNANERNTWACFVKDFEIDCAPVSFNARIASDSKYWLWVNGRLIIFEGGLKRGQSRFSTYYDNVELAQYMNKGMNRVAVLVWYFGDMGFSHISGEGGGLLFESDIICSDKTWKARKHPAYAENIMGEYESNFRLAESNVYFDAAKDLGEWMHPEYDISGWECASEACERIRRRYKDMVEADYSTLWEYWDTTGTKNHAWSGGPLIIMGKYGM